MKNRITFFVVLSLLVFVSLACRNLFDNPREEHIPPDISVNDQTNNSNQAVNSETNDRDSATGSSAEKSVDNTTTTTSLSNTVSGGVLNGKATNLVKPAYPAAAKAVRASGAVNVQVMVDEKGDVTSASAVSGHPLLRASAVEAARQSKFSPTILGGKPVKVRGVIVYNFVPE